MKFYRILRRLTSIRSPRLRLLLFLGAHTLRRRTIGLYVDPTLACNLRCRMCQFSSDEMRRTTLRGRMTDEALAALPASLMHHALKLQIGCGAEPTVDSRTASIIAAGRAAGVPYISVTTNGQLLTPELLRQYIDAGLNEVTISLHGVTPSTYEALMPGATHSRFLQLIDTLREAKRCHPQLTVRVNFTVNADNVDELPILPGLFGTGLVDILQLRPVQNLGHSDYTNFDLQPLVDKYETTFGLLRQRAIEAGITCLMPQRDQIILTAKEPGRLDILFEQLTYCYVGPHSSYAEGFALPGDTYSSYHKRNHTTRRILRALLMRNTPSQRHITRKLNYRL
ncbi:MAG: radical SAM protein [Paramuribaculum sp.]|nr:radical SAM protein [Paramuribaculum sp.]